MNRIHRIAGLLLFSALLFQCQKEVSYVGGPDAGLPSATTPEPLTATLQGNITDEINQPAAGVTVTVGSQTIMTNASGYFRITNASLDKNTSLITADKAGYFKGYRVFAATSGTNQVFIKLIKKNLAGSFSSSAGGSASLSNGAIISLPANGVVIASSGASYTGDVKVYASYIDPQAADINQVVPGSFIATDKNGKRVVLSSSAMLAVELASSSGEKLQIKTGAVATLTMPVSSPRSIPAPASIALWYVDEQTGIWKEEGMAVKQGNNYVGEVSHFSFWNCDRFFAAVSLSLKLVNAKNLPLVHVAAKVTDVDSGAYAYGYTDSLGQVKGMVPANRNLLLEVLDPCGNVIYSKQISPLTKNTELGTIIINSAGSSLLSVAGKILDCSNAPVKKGYAIINFNNIVRYAATDASGNFETSFITCPGSPVTAQVIGIDQSSQQQSVVSTVSITAPATSTGNIIACGTSSVQYINYTLDGVDYHIENSVTDSIYASKSAGTTNEIAIYGSLSPNYLRFSVHNATAAGTYPVNNLALNKYRIITLTQPFNVIFTTFAKSTGEFFEGTFSGKFTADSAATIHTISSSFKVRLIN